MLTPERARDLLEKLMAADVAPWRPIPSRKVAALLGVSLQTLANWRVRGTGPDPEPHRRGAGNRTFYSPSKIAAWLSSLAGEPLEPWEVTLAWLAKRGLELDDPSEKSASELASLIDSDGQRTFGTIVLA